MKQLIILLVVFLNCSYLSAQWKPAGERIKTEWATKIDVENVLPEYPRPIMERPDWMNLNGLWNYAIAPVGQAAPQKYDGQILVPFAIESSLSGVGKRLGKDNDLWYQRKFSVPSKWKGERVLLHFGAVDWKADIWVNQIKIGQHTGGFTPFSFDITPALKNGENELVVKVWDPTDNGTQPRGKQVNKPSGIWYTPVSGIWQTVWLESVPAQFITNIKTTPDIDLNKLVVEVATDKKKLSSKIEVKVFDGKELVAKGISINGVPVEVAMPADVKLWSPDSPSLYDLEISLFEGNKQIDKVKSYAAMRKFSTKRDKIGIVRLQLNNKDLFQFGPLDQGWWPDGLYTAPTDEALLFDIKKTKDWGFNMIRKHVKVEPARWYYHCDKEGILVWQDMPSGDHGSYIWDHHVYNGGKDNKRTPESKANYYREWKEIMDLCVSNPSVVVWVPFNEAWGQFETEKAAEWTKTYDPSRLVNPASGGNHRPCGDILDLHNYPAPDMFLFDPKRVNVLGEYGGIGLPVENHLWWNKRNWGYVQFKNSDEVTAEYVKYANIYFL